MPHAKKPTPLYPLHFKEIYKRKIWGGNGLRKVLHKRGCPPHTGESWEVAVRDGATSRVAHGPLKGKSLAELIERAPREILGDEHSMRFHQKFPLLMKFINAQERLSLQVHPSDDFVQEHDPGQSGKMEAWIVIHAPPEAKVIRGVLPGTSSAEFTRLLQDGRVEECLNVMSVKEGDIIFLTPGTIHSAWGDVILLEVQQNSDTTYRLTDWERRDFSGKMRTLRVEKALKTIDFYSMGVSKYKPIRLSGYNYKRKLLLKCEKFVIELLEFSKRHIKEKANPSRFHILTVLQGNGTFLYGPKGKQKLPFQKGQTFFMPAYLGNYEIASRGTCRIVYTYVEES